MHDFGSYPFSSGHFLDWGNLNISIYLQSMRRREVFSIAQSQTDVIATVVLKGSRADSSRNVASCRLLGPIF